MLTAVTNRRKSGTKPLNQDGEQLRSSLMSFINHRERRPIVRRPPGFICKSFVDALPAANKQRSGRWSTLPPTLQCHLPAWAPGPMVPALDGGCGGGGGGGVGICLSMAR